MNKFHPLSPILLTLLTFFVHFTYSPFSHLIFRCVAAGVGLREIEGHLDKRSLKVTRRPGNAKAWRSENASQVRVRVLYLHVNAIVSLFVFERD